MDTALMALLIIAWASCYFFWGRGLLTGRKEDAVAGGAIGLALVMLLLLTSSSSALSIPVAGFGVVTIAVAKRSKAFDNGVQRSLVAVGALIAFVGFALAVIL